MARRHDSRKRRAARRPRSKVSRPIRIPVERTDVPPDFSIIGVGASAGGFEAFTHMLDAMPPDPKLAMVFVQHLAPNHASSLASLLTGYSKLPVSEAVEGVRLEANHVYVVPPNVQMELVDGHLHLGPRPEDRTQYTPIDFFFRSLARTLQNHAIGVVLSGTASDGSAGVREIKSMGGITVAQDPATAKYDGMPRSAIATQMIDLVLPPRDIATKLVQIAKHPYPPPPPAGKRHIEPTITEEQLERVFALLLPACGVDFMHYKTPTIIRRLFRRMTLLRMDDAEAYITFLEQTPAEVVNLHNELLIHVTRFFREPEAFAALANLLPDITASGAPLRGWVAGCATGEEVYSLAMLIHETIGDRLGEARVQIFGTDVSESAVEYARHGLYPTSIAADVSPERLRRFFTRGDGGYRVTKSLRDMCVFARQDLTRDPPFSRLDLICCRNVLIYMDMRLQKKLLSMFHYALKPKGVLLLGHAESIGYHSELFSLMDKKYRIFKKKPGVVTSAGELDVSATRVRADRGVRSARGAQSNSRVVLNEANRIVIERYAPPSVLVDHNFHVVQFNGQTGPYLEPSPGEPSFHVLKLAREGLLHGLRTALQAARKTRKATRRQGLRVRNGADWHDVEIEVLPIVQQNQTFYLVLFEKPKATLKKASKAGRAGGRAEPRVKRVAKLEEELAATREYLQSTVQEIEAANEELQSANEEILSSNEELQSTNEELDTAKEELQSTNEELNTVNDELHGRNEELTRVNADLLNLLASVQIAIVIVSRDLRIRRFTPMAEKVFNLIPGDIGRPFSQISTNLVSPELLSMIAEVIDSVTPVERTVKDTDGKSYSLRIRPYKSADNRIEGAVITLFDLEPAKKPRD